MMRTISFDAGRSVLASWSSSPTTVSAKWFSVMRMRPDTMMLLLSHTCCATFSFACDG